MKKKLVLSGFIALMMCGTSVNAQSGGSVIDMSDQNPPASGNGWTFASNTYTIADGAIVTVTGDNTATGNHIDVHGNVAMTLQDATITANGATDFAPIYVAGDATLNLDIEGTNTLISGAPYAAIFTDPASTLVIDGNGTLNATGGGTHVNCGAGIGGAQVASGNITINGGTIMATSGNGAGIGGGTYSASGIITINGGMVTATSADGGSGIGGGIYGAGGIITINGGMVTATGGNCAGIGNGYGYDAGHAVITINGGSVNATASNTPINGNSEPVYLNTLTVGNPALADAAITACNIANYGINDVKTDNSGKLYFYLKATSAPEMVSVVANGTTYENTYLRLANNSNNSTLLLPPSVTTLPATDITPTTATLNSSITAGDETIAEQGWYYKKSSDTQWVKTTDSNVTGLTSNTAYDFFAYASTDACPLVSGDTLSFTIKKGTPVATDFSFTPVNSPTVYTGSPQGVTVSSSLTSIGAITTYYTGINGTSYISSTTAPTNAGDYTISIDVTEGTAYFAVTGLALSGTFTIDKATPDMNLTSAGGNYSDNDVALTATVHNVGIGVTAGTVEFKEGDTELAVVPLDNSGVAIYVVPSLIAQGIHTYTAEYSGDDNYNGVAGKSCTVDVSEFLLVSPTMLNFNAAGEIKTFTVACNNPDAHWTLGNPASWLTISSGDDGAMLMKADANPTADERHALVVFSIPGVTSQSIAVTQDAADKTAIESVGAPAIIVYSQNGDVIVKSDVPVQRVAVYDVSGKALKAVNGIQGFNGSITIGGLPKQQVLIVRVTTSLGIRNYETTFDVVN